MDTVTPDNEELFREAFCIETGHTKDCVCETVTLMAKMMAGVCGQVDMPINEMLERIDVEEFKKHLEAILDQKECDCKNVN